MSISEVPAPIKTSLKITERKLVISNSSKRKPLLNALKARLDTPTDYLKKQEPSKKHHKNKLKSSNRS